MKPHQSVNHEFRQLVISPKEVQCLKFALLDYLDSLNNLLSYADSSGGPEVIEKIQAETELAQKLLEAISQQENRQP
jgi:hypothetical protein